MNHFFEPFSFVDWKVFEDVSSDIAVASVARHRQGDVLSQRWLKMAGYDE